jgi:hypothetical protein
MTMALDDLKRLLDGQGLKYFLAPDRPTAMLGMMGPSGPYQFVVKLEVDGRFLQFRTVALAYCPDGHEHLEAVLRVLAAVNTKVRLFKFAWDANDGEIVGYADVWLEDAVLSEAQFKRMLHNFVPVIDMNLSRIRAVIDGGEDPGELGGKTSGLPGSMKDLLDLISKKKKEEEEKKKAADTSSGPTTI